MKDIWLAKTEDMFALAKGHPIKVEKGEHVSTRLAKPHHVSGQHSASSSGNGDEHSGRSGIGPVKLRKKSSRTKPVDTESWRQVIRNRPKVLFEHQVDEVVIREYTNIDIEGALIVEGFPAEGVGSILTAQFLVESLKLPLVGDVDSPSFPPVCSVKNFVPAPGCRIYGDRRIVVFVTEYMLSPAVAKNIADAILEFARRHRCRGILTLDGYPVKSLEDGDESDGADQTSQPAHLDEAEKPQAHGAGPEQAHPEHAAGAGHPQRTPDEKDEEVQRNGSSVKEDREQEDDDDQEEDKDEDEDEDDDLINHLNIGIGRGLRGGSIGMARGGGGDEDDDEDDDAVGTNLAATESPEEVMAELQKASQQLERQLTASHVKFLTNSETFGDMCLSFRHRPLKDGFIQGSTGAFVSNLLLTDDVNLLCLLTPYHPLLTDTKGCLLISKTILKLIGLETDIDMSKLESRVRKLEEKIKIAIERLTGPSSQTAPQSMYS